MLHPFLRNLTENIAAVQFDHRVLASVTLCFVSILAAVAPIAGLPGSMALCILAAVLARSCLGVATLLLVDTVALAVAHEFGAIVLLAQALLKCGVHRLTAAGSRPCVVPQGLIRILPWRRRRAGRAPVTIVAVVDTVSLEAIISTIPFGLAVINSARRIVLMNAAFHASLGLEPGRVCPAQRSRTWFGRWR